MSSPVSAVTRALSRLATARPARSGERCRRAVLLACCGVMAASPLCFGHEGHGHRPASSTLGTVIHPQLAVEADGTVLLLWGQVAGNDAGDLYVARWLKGDQLGEATRVNDRAGSVVLMQFDEIRPSIAVGPSGRLAVAWTDTAGDVRVAEGGAHGARFAPSLRLNQDHGRARQAFVVVAYGGDQTLCATWLDPRRARPGEEEPADLYYARVTSDKVDEHDLTSAFSPSVCGCCRPWIGQRPDGRLAILFRNASADGYRDIFETQQQADGGFGAPERMGPAQWKVRGCPTMGPCEVEGSAFWRDGSTGTIRLLRAQGTQLRGDLVTVVGATQPDWQPTLSPRTVATRALAPTAVLVPGQPAPVVLARAKGDWGVAAFTLPAWAVTAADRDGALLCAGVRDGKLALTLLPLAARPGAQASGG